MSARYRFSARQAGGQSYLSVGRPGRVSGAPPESPPLHREGPDPRFLQPPVPRVGTSAVDNLSEVGTVLEPAEENRAGNMRYGFYTATPLIGAGFPL